MISGTFFVPESRSTAVQSAVVKTVPQVALALWLLVLPAYAPALDAHDIYAGSNATHTEADQHLNAAYRRTLARIHVEQPERADFVISRLRRSQRAWLKFREAQVSLVGTYHGIGSSSARAADMASYYSDLTDARIRDLETVPDPF